MKLLNRILNTLRRKDTYTRAQFAKRQFNELIRRNLALPVQTYQL